MGTDEYGVGIFHGDIVYDATMKVGPALFLTAIVLACGLGITVFSDLPSLRLFGMLSAVTLLAALVGDLVILPATAYLARLYLGRPLGGASLVAPSDTPVKQSRDPGLFS